MTTVEPLKADTIEINTNCPGYIRIHYEGYIWDSVSIHYRDDNCQCLSFQV